MRNEQNISKNASFLVHISRNLGGKKEQHYSTKTGWISVGRIILEHQKSHVKRRHGVMDISIIMYSKSQKFYLKIWLFEFMFQSESVKIGEGHLEETQMNLILKSSTPHPNMLWAVICTQIPWFYLKIRTLLFKSRA